MGLGKPQLYVKIKVAAFIYYGNIRESIIKRQICFLSHHLGELGVPYGLLHLQLAGKRVADFLFEIIELFSLALMFDTL